MARVIVDVHVPDVDKVFDYAIPPHLKGLEPGHRVLVPFGHRKAVEGYVIEVVGTSMRSDLKEIHRVLDERPLIAAADIAVALWMQQRYLCPLVQALQCFLPPGARLRGSQRARTLTRKAFQVTASAHDESLMAGLKARAPKQAVALAYLLEQKRPMTAAQIEKQTGVARPSLKSLVEKGLIQEIDLQIERNPVSPSSKTRPPITLNADQQRALQTIVQAVNERRPAQLLLEGVTGSGKTEVYMQAIAATKELGRGALLLVPEIALTPQTVAAFREFFGDGLAVLHSRLSTGERYDQWQRIKEGRVSIVIGARSAVFAPLDNLGLIVIDEEHETSYKQDESPRYHAREVAWARALEKGAVLLLGSATPALTTRFQAENKQGNLLRLPGRVEKRPMPDVEIVDMREELLQGNRSMFSRVLKHRLASALDRGEQALLFMNRRGFASFLLCRECGHVPHCQSCEVSLTLHQPGDLRCHYCDAHKKMPSSCPQCGSVYLRPFGGGTQRVEEELKKAFPHVRAVRMDVDTTRRKGAHQQIYEAFSQGRYDVLIGTQMIAKGLHFPSVSFVGVVSADTGLHFPDYRAAERTFQLLTQVAGRAGRGDTKGFVTIQTYAPDHYAIIAAQNHDYEGFFRRELDYRKSAFYPPFSTLIRCLWSGEDEDQVRTAAMEGGHFLSSHVIDTGIQILGPSPAPISRLKDRFRWHLLLRGDEEETIALARLLKETTDKKGASSVRLAIDVDPMNLL